MDEASKAGASGEADSSNALFKEANEIHDRLQTIGGFLPVFHHHPNEGGFDVYPTVPNDVGKLVLVCRGVLPVIERTLYP